MNFVTNGLMAAPSPTETPPAMGALVCWSRMQAEAGQALEAIICRKELERRVNGGVFMWGVGNAPARLTRVLARTAQPVRAIFSIMKSKPRVLDATATELLLWGGYIDADGIGRQLPAGSIVTSRAGTGKGRKRAHYALMCHSDSPLRIDRHGARFDPTAFRNAGEVGGPVGASQVTALLRQVAEQREDAAYEVNMEARLTAGYWVQLTCPTPIERHHLAALDHADAMTEAAWRDLVHRVRPAVEQHHVDVGSLL